MKKVNKSPCLDCEERHIGYHDKCERYQITRKEYTNTYDQTDEYFRNKKSYMIKRFGL